MGPADARLPDGLSISCWPRNAKGEPPWSWSPTIPRWRSDTLLMIAASIAIFVFGLMLQRRREYVTMRAQGMQTQQVRALVLGEALLVAVCGLIAGIVVGGGMAYLLVHILRPLFILSPSLTVPTGELAKLALLAIAATLASALTASAILSRLKPTELLREA